jgi:hypothetical protein
VALELKFGKDLIVPHVASEVLVSGSMAGSRTAPAGNSFIRGIRSHIVHGDAFRDGHLLQLKGDFIPVSERASYGVAG